MRSPTTRTRQIVLQLTGEQSREIERSTGKLVTELQIEIVEAPEPLDGPRVELLIPNHTNSIK